MPTKIAPAFDARRLAILAACTFVAAFCGGLGLGLAVAKALIAATGTTALTVRAYIADPPKTERRFAREPKGGADAAS